MRKMLMRSYLYFLLDHTLVLRHTLEDSQNNKTDRGSMAEKVSDRNEGTCHSTGKHHSVVGADRFRPSYPSVCLRAGPVVVESLVLTAYYCPPGIGIVRGAPGGRT